MFECVLKVFVVSEGFLKVLEGFGKDLGRMLEGFWKDLEREHSQNVIHKKNEKSKKRNKKKKSEKNGRREHSQNVIHRQKLRRKMMGRRNKMVLEGEARSIPPSLVEAFPRPLRLLPRRRGGLLKPSSLVPAVVMSLTSKLSESSPQRKRSSRMPRKHLLIWITSRTPMAGTMRDLKTTLKKLTRNLTRAAREAFCSRWI